MIQAFLTLVTVGVAAVALAWLAAGFDLALTADGNQITDRPIRDMARPMRLEVRGG
jgi:hypothetical protein